MAVGTPVLEVSETKTSAQADEATASFTINDGDAVVAFNGYDDPVGGEPPLAISGGVGAATFTIVATSNLNTHRIYGYVWAPPGSGTYTISGQEGNIDRGLLVYSVPGVATSTPADGGITDNTSTGGDTGPMNVTSATGDRVMMGIIGQSPIGDQTELDEITLPGSLELMAQHADGSATVDIGATSIGNDDLWAAVAFNLNAESGAPFAPKIFEFGVG